MSSWETGFTTRGVVTKKRTLLPGGQYRLTLDVPNSEIRLASRPSGASYLNLAFVVVEGPVGSADPTETAGRSQWHNLFLYEHMIDADGGLNNLAKALGTEVELQPNDELGPIGINKTEDGVAICNSKDEPCSALNCKHVMAWLGQIDGSEVDANIGIEKGSARSGGGTYPDKNVITSFVEVLATEEEAPDATNGEAEEEQAAPQLAPEPVRAVARPAAPKNGKTTPAKQPQQRAPIAAKHSARPAARR